MSVALRGVWLLALLVSSAYAELTPAPALNHGVWPDHVSIALPPGPGGSAPVVQIGHDHHAADGVLGSGHRLQVGSVITRHGPTGGVFHGEESLYRLDGQLLVQVDDGLLLSHVRSVLPPGPGVPVTGLRFATAHHFEPETFTGARLTYDDASNTWTMRNNGWTWTYGSTTGTGTGATLTTGPQRFMSTFGPVWLYPLCADGKALCYTAAWHLSRAVDPAGNEILYDYTTPAVPAALADPFDRYDTRQMLLSDIRYGDAAVHFEYDERPDPRAQSPLGVPQLMTHRLVGIESTGRAGAVFSRYAFEYKDEGLDCDGAPIPSADEPDLVDAPLQTLLRRIVRRSSTDASERVLRCVETHHDTPTYSEETVALPAPADWAATATDKARAVMPVALNLNGDGITDLVVLAWQCETACTAFHKAYIAKPDSANGFVDADSATGDDKTVIDRWEAALALHLGGHVAQHNRGFVFGDVDGDLTAELLVEDASAGAAPGAVWLVEIGGSTASAYAMSGLDGCTLRYAQLGDVDGDGAADLIRNAHTADDHCSAQSSTRFVRNSDVFPYFAWSDAEQLHVPLEKATPPEDWTAAQASCAAPFAGPPDDYTEVDSVAGAVATHSRYGDFNGDGVVDVAYALHGCFDWVVFSECDYWQPIEETFYARIFYGVGDGTFFDSGIHPGEAMVQYRENFAIPSGGEGGSGGTGGVGGVGGFGGGGGIGGGGIGDAGVGGPGEVEGASPAGAPPPPSGNEQGYETSGDDGITSNGYCIPDASVNMVVGLDVDRSGHVGLVRTELDTAGLRGGLDRGLLAGYGMGDAARMPTDLSIGSIVATGNTPHIESAVLADFDGDGFVDALSIYHGPASGDHWTVEVSWSNRDVAEGRVETSIEEAGGETALTWGFSAGHDNPDLALNLEVLERLDGANGALEFRYGDGAANRRGFRGFGYAERENARGGIDGFAWFQDDGRLGQPEYLLRRRADGSLEHVRVFLRGLRTEGTFYQVGVMPPYFNPLFRQCDFEIGHPFMGNQSVTVEQLMRDCAAHDNPFDDTQGLTLQVYPFDTSDLPLGWWEYVDVDDAQLQPSVLERRWIDDQWVTHEHVDWLANWVPRFPEGIPFALLGVPPDPPAGQQSVGPVALVPLLGGEVQVQFALQHIGLAVHTQPVAIDSWLRDLDLDLIPGWTFEPDPGGLDRALPDEIQLPAAAALPTVSGTPVTQVDGFITDWLFDADARRLDQRYDHKDVSVTDDDLRSTFTWERPSSGFWYRLTEAIMTDHAGARQKASRRDDFTQFDHAQKVIDCGITDSACATELFTYHADGTLASRTRADGSVDAWTYSWCGRLEEHTDPVGRVRTFEFDDQCRVTADVWQGARTDYAYDGYNRRIETRLDPGGGAPITTVDTLYADSTDDALADVTWVRGDGQISQVWRDEYDRPRYRSTCLESGGGCAADTEIISEWRGYSRDGAVIARAAPYAPGETASTTRFTHDAYGRVQVIQGPAPVDLRTDAPAWTEATVTFGPGWRRLVDPLGRTLHTTRSTLSKVVSFEGVTQLDQTFDAFGRLLQEIGPSGVATVWAHDDRNRERTATRVDAADCVDATGATIACTHEITFEYDARDRRVGRLGADGSGLRTTYDASGRPLSTRHVAADGTETALRSFVYDDALGTVDITDESGNVLHRIHDALGRPLEETFVGMTTAWSWGLNGRPATITGPDGLETVITYDAHDRPERIEHPRPGAIDIEYTARGARRQTVDADGATHTWAYLFSGQLAEHALGSWILERYTRDDAGRAVELERGGVRSAQTFDAFDRVTRVERGVADDGSFQTWAEFEYDAGHRLTAQTVGPVDAGSARTEYTYDPWGRLSAISDPLGAARSFAYDVVGRLRLTQDAEGFVAERAYDARGRLASEDVPGAGALDYTHTTGVAFDGLTGLRQLDIEDGEGDVTTEYRDGLGRLVHKILGDGTARRLTWADGRHTATEWLDTAGATVREKRWLFDAATGRLQTEQGPAAPHEFGGSIYDIGYTWTAAARLASIVTPGETTSFGYDADGLLATEAWGDLTRHLDRDDPYPWVSGERLIGLGATRETTFTRDPAARIIERIVTNGDATATETHSWTGFDAYDGPGVVSSVVDGDTIEHAYTYRLDGLVESRETFDGGVSLGTTTWSYFDNGVLEQIDTPGGRSIVYDYGAPFDHLLDRVHDGAGHDYAQFVSRNGRGQPLRIDLDSEQRVFEYDGVGRTVARRAGPLSGALLLTWTGVFNPLGQLEMEEYIAPDAAWVNTYAYDTTGRLIEEFHGASGLTLSYTLDRSGNRLTTTEDDGTTTVTTLAATYTGDRLETVNGVAVDYDDWDAIIEDHRGQLIERSASGRIRSVSGSDSHTLARDASGLAVRSTDGAGDRVTTWGKDPSQLPLEVTQPNGSVHTYVQAEGLLLEKLRTFPSGAISRQAAVQDVGGTLDRLGNQSKGGATAFGVDADSMASERFMFHKMERLPGVDGLMLARHRAYDSELGRFISPDPTGLSGGAHRTLYGNGDPVQFHDPMGLVAVVVDGTLMDLSAGTVQAMLATGFAKHAETDMPNYYLGPMQDTAVCGCFAPCSAVQDEDGGEGEGDTEGDTGADTDAEDGGDADAGETGGTDITVTDHAGDFIEWTDGEGNTNAGVIFFVEQENGTVTYSVDSITGVVKLQFETGGTQVESGATPSTGGPLEVPGSETGTTTPDGLNTPMDTGGETGANDRGYWGTRADIVSDIVSERMSGLMDNINGAIDAAATLGSMAMNPVDTFMNYSVAGRLIQGDLKGAASLGWQQATFLPSLAVGVGWGMAQTAGRALIAPVEVPYRSYQFFFGQDEATIRAGANGYIDSAGAALETASYFTGGGVVAKGGLRATTRGLAAAGRKGGRRGVTRGGRGAGGGKGRTGRGDLETCPVGGCNGDGCFTADTLVETEEGLVSISSLSVGDRVRTPLSTAKTDTEVDEGWVHIVLKMPNPKVPQDSVRVELLRPSAWLIERNAKDGEWVYLRLKHMNLDGFAQVEHISPAVRPADGMGRVVTGVMSRKSADVHVLTLDDRSTLQPTSLHPFWSADRGTWIKAGMLMKGERVVTLGGLRIVESIARKPGVHQVFNLEVEVEHVYFVGSARALVHNSYGPDEPSDATIREAMERLGDQGIHPGQEKVSREIIRDYMEEIDDMGDVSDWDGIATDLDGHLANGHHRTVAREIQGVEHEGIYGGQRAPRPGHWEDVEIVDEFD